MALAEYQYRNPLEVLDIEQTQHIKRTRGCAACQLRDKHYALGDKHLCSLPGNAPGRLGFCRQWQHDEGVGHGVEK